MNVFRKYILNNRKSELWIDVYTPRVNYSYGSNDFKVCAHFVYSNQKLLTDGDVSKKYMI